MTIRYASSKPVTYRALPPKMRVLEPEGSIPNSARDYLQKIDQEHEQPEYGASRGRDLDESLVLLVFGNQLRQHEDNSNTLANLILNRRQLTAKHLADIQWRMDELIPRRAIMVQEVGPLSEIEKQLIDLERQKRQVQLNEWRDLMDLRRALTEERRQYHAVRARADYLTGGYGASD